MDPADDRSKSNEVVVRANPYCLWDAWWINNEPILSGWCRRSVVALWGRCRTGRNSLLPAQAEVKTLNQPIIRGSRNLSPGVHILRRPVEMYLVPTIEVCIPIGGTSLASAAQGTQHSEAARHEW